MVDRGARRKYAELVRQFISGRMTNDEYEEGLMGSEDTAISEIHQQVWGLYDDLETHRMVGKHYLAGVGRRTIAQAVLFLQSDQEYNWPTFSFWGMMLYPLLVLCGIVTAVLISCLPALTVSISMSAVCLCLALITFVLLKCKRENKLWEMAGDQDAWPFLHQAELDEAKRHPKLLNGKHTMP